MKFLILILLVSTSALAQDPTHYCKHQDECDVLDANFVMGSLVEYGDLKLDPVLDRDKLDKLDKVAHITPSYAKEICNDLGGRAPTARQLAMLATLRGAKGIAETAYADRLSEIPQVRDEAKEMNRLGYDTQIFQDTMGTHAYSYTTLFYYSSAGFRLKNGRESEYGRPGQCLTSASYIHDSGAGISYYKLCFPTGQIIPINSSADVLRCVFRYGNAPIPRDLPL